MIAEDALDRGVATSGALEAELDSLTPTEVRRILDSARLRMLSRAWNRA